CRRKSLRSGATCGSCGACSRRAWDGTIRAGAFTDSQVVRVAVADPYRVENTRVTHVCRPPRALPWAEGSQPFGLKRADCFSVQAEGLGAPSRGYAGNAPSPSG